jgi:hypothetical protein
MEGVKNQELLADKRVKDEIEKHRWLESEKAGKDIGFDKAARDWMNRFSDAWIKANLIKGKAFGRNAKRI